jgi:hypothetical protein
MAKREIAMTVNDIWEKEKSFWLDGPAFYVDHMVADAQMVFPDPVGILKGDEILHGLKEAPRWQSVEIEEKTEASSGDTLVLAYRAAGRRGIAAPYRALCSSCYIRQGDTWKLISHQQTPIT